MKSEKCLVIEKHKKGWFNKAWTSKYYVHEWVYKNKEKRICFKCKKREILFGIDYYNGIKYEDWR